MRSRARSLAEKSLEAMLAAIEIYNKPNFAYREESFTILAMNAWELLLKARILQLDQNRLSAILVFEKRRKTDGSLSEKLYRRKNRSGAHLSIGLFAALDRLTSDYEDSIPVAVRQNLELVGEVRDNAVHFLNKGFDLAKLVQEIGTSCARNYLGLTQRWFGMDLSEYNFFLMPLAFVGESRGAEAVLLNPEERRVLSYLQAETAKADNDDDYSVSLSIDLRFVRGKGDNAEPVVISDNPDATPVQLTEEDIRDKYPWDYAILTGRLKKRYKTFKQNAQYHRIRKPLEADERYCNKRFLDPANRRGIGKCFYNPNILKVFDQHYARI